MAIVIKGIKLLSKTKLGRKALSTAEKAVRRAASRKRARQSTKSIDKYSIKAGAAGSKGPVPAKKQSAVKSTLSGRTYSIATNKLSAKTMLDIGGGYGTTTTARFQDAVKDLIGLDKLSIRKAYKRGRGKK
jgi:hypothetical protein